MFGHRYFLCRPHHGIFLRPYVLAVVEKAVDAVLLTGKAKKAVDATDLEAFEAAVSPRFHAHPISVLPGGKFDTISLLVELVLHQLLLYCL